MTTYENLRVARRGPIVSIAAYLLLTIAKLIAGHFLNSSSLIADGFNNLSDILGNVALLIGLQLASQPADSDHRFGHWKIEDLSSLVTSFIMFVVGFQIQTVRKIFLREETVVDPLGAAVGVLSAIVMCAVYFYNKGLAKKLKSSALIAAAKDNLSDAVTSIGTSIAIVAASFNLTIIDYITAIIITFFILKTAYDIFMEATFSLSDGFDERNLKAYEKAILNIPKVTKVKKQRGRSYGSNIYLDIVVEMNPDLSVYESHAITEQIEEILSKRFSVYDTDVHVEPAAIPEDEIYGNVLRKLIRNEKIILSKIPGYENLLAPDFFLIDENGHRQNREDVIANHQPLLNNFDKFKMTSISQKTKLISYELGGNFHTSIWRRNETWFMIYHQVTAIKDKE